MNHQQQIEHISTLLKNNKKRVTFQRIRVIDSILRQDKSFTPYDIEYNLKGEINITTIYNSINTFLDLRVIKKSTKDEYSKDKVQSYEVVKEE